MGLAVLTEEALNSDEFRAFAKRWLAFDPTAMPFDVRALTIRLEYGGLVTLLIEANALEPEGHDR